MTDNEKRIKIAEKCGWTFEHIPNGPYNYEGWNARKDDKQRWFIHKSETYNEASHKQALDAAGVPDYLSDLNAMHEAEKVLAKDAQWPRYLHQLCCVICGDSDEPYNQDATTVWCMIHATAAQRADAFLRTIGEEL